MQNSINTIHKNEVNQKKMKIPTPLLLTYGVFIGHGGVLLIRMHDYIARNAKQKQKILKPRTRSKETLECISDFR